MASMTNDEVVLPASVELAWGLRDQARRGPKPGLTLDRIVAAGIEVARTDGIAAVSMARVAGELGVGTMSLYRYVGAKDELISLMADTAFGPPLPGPAGVRLWARLTPRATELRASERRNLLLVQLPITAALLVSNHVAGLVTVQR